MLNTETIGRDGPVYLRQHHSKIGQSVTNEIRESDHSNGRNIRSLHLGAICYQNL